MREHIMERTGILAVMVGVLVWGGVAGAAERAEAARQRRARRAERLAEAVRAIRQAGDVRSAAAAYARGRAVENLNADVLDAYVRKTLQLGRPDLAYYAAAVLVRVRPDSGTAWGVVGYVRGREGRFAAALEATVRAAELLPDDPSIQNNAGQLIAMYDLAPTPPRIANAVKRKLERVRPRLAAAVAFSRAYTAVRAARERHGQAQKQLREDERIAEEALRDVRGQLLALARSLREINARIADHEAELRRLRDAYRYACVVGLRGLHPCGVVRTVHVGACGGPCCGTAVVRSPYHLRRQLRADIDAEEQKIAALEAQADTVRAHGYRLLDELEQKRSRLEVLRSRMQPAGEVVWGRLHWDPPAVDEVVTDEAPHGLPAPPRKPASAFDPRHEAEQKLKLARLYARHGMPQKARAAAKALLRDWAGTPAAREARTFLAELAAE
jgi:tetratricopeptide (TPR) repeat protein